MEVMLAALRAVAEPTRMRILMLCARAELTVSELTQILGQSQPRVSRHLRLLCDAGLLERFREGTWAFFRLAERGRCGELVRTLIDLVPTNERAVARDLERLEEVRRTRAEAAAAYFRANAAQWDKIRSLHVDDREVERALLAMVPKTGIRDLLDVGTGTGRMLRLLGKRAEHAVGIDLSREMLAIARANLDRAGLRNCLVRQADMYQLPFADQSFDAAVIHQVLHYAEQPAAVLAEVARVLRAGGRLYVIDFGPHHQEVLRKEHAHRRLGFADEEVAQWCRSVGLSAESVLHLPGDPLTVSIWPAVRAGAGANEPGHATAH
ncbi:MAG: ArsR/SmtB family transcription factor [Kiloniellales bacterium]